MPVYEYMYNPLHIYMEISPTEYGNFDFWVIIYAIDLERHTVFYYFH